MSFDGRLEDLGVCSILQLIGLGKKSGTLTLERGQERGRISFVAGEVVLASSSNFSLGLRELLLARKLVTREHLEAAARFQQKLKKQQPIGVILKFFHPAIAGDIEQVIVAQIERIVIDFCGWSQGTFSFCPKPVDPSGSTWLNPLDLILEKGFCPLQIAIEGTTTAATDESFMVKLMQRQQRRTQGRFDLLRAMLTELQQPDSGGGILLLILRYASELMARGMIFDVRGARLVGLGQFGLSGAGQLDALVRQLKLDIASEPLFSQVVKEKVPARGALNSRAVRLQLRTVLGVLPEEVLVAPLVHNDRVVALLYGDGFHAALSPLAIDTFAVFLTQAGIAMERALETAS